MEHRARRNRRTENTDRAEVKPLLTAADVARQLQVSKSQAYALMRSGEMVVVQIGRSIRVAEEDLRAYVEAQKRRPRSYAPDLKTMRVVK